MPTHEWGFHASKANGRGPNDGKQPMNRGWWQTCRDMDIPTEAGNLTIDARIRKTMSETYVVQ